MNDIIIVSVDSNNNCTLEYPKINLKTKVYIGRNGVTNDKLEGDMKTPLGEFNIGLVMGFEDLKLDNIKYTKIEDYMYFVDDVNSKYYNQLVNINEIDKDFNSSEHLIDYPVQYKYLIEIKSNPDNIKGKGSAIFMHCKNLDYTYGCVSLDSNDMLNIIKNITSDTKIRIQKI